MKRIILFTVFALFYSLSFAQPTPTSNLPLVGSPAVVDSDQFINTKHDSTNQANRTTNCYALDLKSYINNNVPFADTGYGNIQYVVPTTGNTIASNGAEYLVIAPAGTLSTLTINFPAAIAKQKFAICFTQAITTLTCNGMGSTINAAPTSATANSVFKWIATHSTWIKQ